MLKAKDIIGMPVIDLEQGKQQGTVKDLWFDQEMKLAAISLDAKHWFSSPRYVVMKHITAIGQDALTIQDESVIDQEVPRAEEWITFSSGDNKIRGMPFITVNGTELGVVDDVYFEGNMDKTVIGYELTDGFISDLKEGRKWLRTPEQLKLGDDAIIAPLDSEHHLEQIMTSIDE